ncbi:helix-turn-helix transcriptional regulator [Frankia sp. Cppng1_Ct_nod]|uniref:helix-turn-helix domain-containing protein n=1 Tax=Frankia sp. Cppng1_Ct_nod TaxID=2897162 RepID=UPI0013EFAA3C|nr:helix-turn-helix transcriptional regulator [Frankia sp. Cppng1_Ct_nod]
MHITSQQTEGETVEDQAAVAYLAGRIRALRLAAGISSLSELARRTHLDRAAISRAENGRYLPSETVVRAIDTAVGAGGELLELRARIQRVRLGIGEPREEVGSTDRRQMLGTSVFTMLSTLAADTSRDIARADPDPLVLVDIDDDIDRFVAVYATTPHAVLIPQVERRWVQVDVALKGRSSLAVHHRLSLAAGRLSYLVSRLAFNLGDFTTARHLAVLAGQYAGHIQDAVLLASVAGMHSGIAYYRKRYDVAVSVFDGYPPDPPYLQARNAAYRARAHGRLGNTTAARAELALMHRCLTDDPPQPGDLPLGEAAAGMFTAGTLGSIGEGAEAEPWARRSVAAYETAGPRANREEWGHALLTLATSLIRRDRPEPEEAARIGVQVLDVVDSHPTHTVTQRAGEMLGMLADHRSLPAVVDFRERLAAAPRPALTA